MSNAILRVHCADRKGIIAGLSDFVFRHGGKDVDCDALGQDALCHVGNPNASVQEHRRDRFVIATLAGSGEPNTGERNGEKHKEPGHDRSR